MGTPRAGNWQRRLVFAAGLLAGPATAGAQEFCVACTEPAQIYRCVIDRAVPTGIPLKFLCVGTLAREGSHASCSVRGGTVFECAGPIRRIDARLAADALARPATVGAAAPGRELPAQPAPPKADPAQPAPQSPAQQPPAQPAAAPRTVEELARQVSRGSGDAIGKAGAAVVEQSRRAWGCVASLFKAC